MRTPPCIGHEFESEEYSARIGIEIKTSKTSMKIENHIIKDTEVNFVKSPNIGAKFKPDSIIIHYTAGSSAESSIKSLTNPTSKASAHIVIGRDGKITQLVPFDTIAWHAGKSEYQGRTAFNRYSVGIEIDNAGLLTKVEGGYKSWFGKIYPENEVVKATHRNETTPKYWHSYTDEQIKATEELCKLLMETYNIKVILGHEEISKGRKIDPGPAFPLDDLRNKLIKQ